MNRRRALKTLFCSSASLALNLKPSHTQAEIAKDALHFLAIGDFGTGSTGQKDVAKGMQEFVAKNSLKTEGLLLVGDNFYTAAPGGFTVDSKQWDTGFESMYPKSVFPGPCCAVLGNHDYHNNAGGELTQLAYAKKPGGRWTMPAKWYRQDFGGATPLLTMICLDSNFPTVSGGTDKKTGLPKNHMSELEEQVQLAWFKAELAKPRAPFTLVMAHHPVYSNGIHGDTKALVAQWDDLLQEHQVHAYLCGHDHDMQHLELEGKFTSYILSGGGGAKVRKLESTRKMPYGQDVNGYTHLEVKPDGMTFTHHGPDGGVLHRFTKRLDGKVEI